jgi:glycosyltransferase involved in cell wall biosynthesis
MKILHVYKDYYPVLGGMENHIRMLAEAQVRMGHSVTVLVTDTTRRTSVERMNGVEVIKAARLATVARAPISLAFAVFLRKQRPDITHLHFPYPLGEVAELFLGRSGHTILTYHSDVVRQKGLLRLYHPLLKIVLRKVDRIIATSDNYVSSSQYLHKVREKCSIIPLGIDLQPFLENGQQETAENIRNEYGHPLILFVGKLRYYKGLHYLLRAMPDIPARLLVIGNGPMEREWKDEAASLNLGDKVLFLGEIDDGPLPHYYKAADVFVLPASERSEAFGLVQVEAMASGLPVISTELGTGTSFVNLSGETGLVVAPRSSGALRDALLTLLGNEELRKAMGARGRKRALREFSLDRMITQTAQLYEEVTGGHARRQC